jgi:hypothetical protein
MSGEHRDPEPDPAWVRLILRHRWIGPSMIFLISAVALWGYTIKAWFDAGWVGIIFILPFAVLGSALSWLMVKFVRLSDRLEHRPPHSRRQR